MKEHKEKVLEETSVQTVGIKEESSISARGSEVQGIVPRKAFSRNILGTNNKITT